MAINPLSYPMPGAFSAIDQGNWDRLAGLGDVYNAAQDRATKLDALARLGTDPNTNIQTLLTSRDPALVAAGLKLQQQQIDNADARARLGIAQAASRRAEGTYQQDIRDRAALPELFKSLGGGGGGAIPQTAPFPAPLPGQSSAPQGFPAPLPQRVSDANASMDMPPEQPRVMAADEDTGLPAWASDPAGLAAKGVRALVSNKPAAQSGIGREQLAAMYANPYTKDLARELIRNQLEPDTWTYHTDNATGRITAMSKRDPSLTRDVTPPGLLKDAAGRMGLGQPMYTRDEKGRLRAYQLSATGVPVEAKFPEGELPLGPGEVAQQKAEGTATGKAVAGAKFGLPDVVRTTDNMVDTIDKIMGHESKGMALGRGSHLPDWMVAGTGIADFRSMVNQLGGEAMQQNMAMLRGSGLGAVSDFEQKNMINAFVRASTAQTEKGFNDAMNDAKRSAEKIRDIARARAKGDFSEKPGTAAPSTPATRPSLQSIFGQ